MITVAIRAVLALVVMCACLIWAARAAEPSPEDRAKFFQDVKAAVLVDGRTINCCGEGDGVKVKLTGFAGGIITAVITDTMRSQNGKVGDILKIPTSLNTVNIFNPFAEPIAFINGLNMPYCLTGNAGI